MRDTPVCEMIGIVKGVSGGRVVKLCLVGRPAPFASRALSAAILVSAHPPHRPVAVCARAGLPRFASSNLSIYQRHCTRYTNAKTLNRAVKFDPDGDGEFDVLGPGVEPHRFVVGISR
jgi:hypothetical protein